MKISDHQLGTKFRSKQDLYQYMTENRKLFHLYLPPKETINKDFIRQVLKEEKKVFQMEEVKFIKVPRFEELSIKKIYQEAREDQNLMVYLPDLNTKNKMVPREFFFNILNTVYPDYLKQLISNSQNFRSRPELNEQKKDYILISDTWFEKLMAQPFISSNFYQIFNRIYRETREDYSALKRKKQKIIPEQTLSLKRFKGMNQSFELNIQNKENQERDEINDDYGEQEASENTQQFNRGSIFKI